MRIKKASPLCMLALTVLIAGFAGPEQADDHAPAGTWDYTLDSPEGTYKGTLVFTETEHGLTGTIASADQAGETPLENIAFEGTTLSFRFENPQAGTLKAKVEVDGDAFDGVLEAPMYGIEMPFKGARTSAPKAAMAEPETETESSATEKAKTSEALSAESKLRALFASEKAKAVLEDHLPGITTHPEIDQAMDMTLREAVEYAPDEALESVLAAISADLQQMEEPAEGESESRSQTEAAEEGGKGLSLDATLRDLLADEEAKTVLEKHIPEVLAHPDIGQGMDLTLPQIAQYAPEAMPQSVLDAIKKDLAEL